MQRHFSELQLIRARWRLSPTHNLGESLEPKEEDIWGSSLPNKSMCRIWILDGVLALLIKIPIQHSYECKMSRLTVEKSKPRKNFEPEYDVSRWYVKAWMLDISKSIIENIPVLHILARLENIAQRTLSLYLRTGWKHKSIELPRRCEGAMGGMCDNVAWESRPWNFLSKNCLGCLS